MALTAALTPVRSTAGGSTRANVFVAGAFYVLTFAASIPAVLLLNPVLTDPNYIVGAGSDSAVLVACLLDIVTALAGIGTTVALFPVLRRHNEAIALGFVTSRMVEGLVILIGVVSLLAVVTLRQQLSTSGDAASLVTVGASLVAVRNWAFLLGPVLMAGINALLFGSLLYRSRLVPRIIPLLGLIGAPLILTSTMLTFFGYNQVLSPISSIATAPIFIWELSIGFWMIFKGFRPSALSSDD